MKQSSRKLSLRERLNISRLAIQFPRITIAFWIAVSVAGIFAFSSLKYALFPDITFPVVIVTAQAPIETTLDTENQLTKPIEKPLQSLERLDELSSSTYPGQTVVKVLFVPGTKLESATEKVKEALTQVSLPPKTTFEVVPIDLNESSAISYAIKGENKSLSQLVQIAKAQIVPQIKQLPGVLKVNLLGDIRSNSPTRVRFNGQDAIALQIIKRSQANTLDVVTQVEQAVQQLQAKFSDLQLVLAETQADYIREATQATIDALIGAIVLAILVIFPFLRNFKATLITALAIPISLLGTFIVMAIAGFNLETMTLLALALVIGIVVDDAIVDVENIARHVEKGENSREAAIKGTGEIGLAVTASTLTIAAVFVPVALMRNAVGEFFKPFGLTVSAAVVFSLLVARTLSPVLAVYWLKPRNNRNESLQRLEARNNSQGAISNAIANNYYRNLLGWSLHNRKIVVAIAILSFASGIALIPLIPKGFIPKLDRGEFNIAYTAPLPKLAGQFQSGTPNTNPKSAERSRRTPLEVNSSTTATKTQNPKSNDGAFAWMENLAKSPERLLLRKTIKVGQQLEEVVLTFSEVESVFTTAGLRGDPTKGKLYIRLKRDPRSRSVPEGFSASAENRQLTTAEVQAKIRAALPTLKGVSASVEDIPFVQTEAEKPIQIAILGENLNLLRKTAQQLETRVEKLPGLVDVALSGQEKQGENALEVERLNGQRVVYLSANLAQQQGLEDAAWQIEQIAQSIFPKGITLKRWGSSAHSSDVLSSFGSTMTLSIFLMLSVLLLLFGRLLEPIAVGLSLPLSIVGAMLGLLATQSDFGVISLLGLIFLLGLLDKNALLLMDYTNQLRESGLSREEALVETGAVRLRPIIMTTASTILGMLPIALGWGAGAELRQPMAVVIIGGLITSSLLSLIVVPVLYTLLEDGWTKMFGKR
ncbi:MAG: efflux RND transporter permease subunit [Hydrococcus sp. C42_A2020_068]|nr:efflux RND transporter permease subunit [Hydrococcus sp. C42_A2020_068]